MGSCFISSLLCRRVYSVYKEVELFRASLNDASVTALWRLMWPGILIAKKERDFIYTPLYCSIWYKYISAVFHFWITVEACLSQ